MRARQDPDPTTPTAPAGTSLPTPWQERVAERLDTIVEQGRWRTVRSLDSGRPATVLTDSRRHVVSFAGNDYLGLSQHPAVIGAARSALDDFGAGAGASRLVVGSRPVHDRLEAAIADWKGRDAALLFSTGYQANVGVLGAIASTARDVVIHSDELNHASIIDGARLSRAEVRVFAHLDLAALDAALTDGRGRPQLVVSDEVFSMDGDSADTAGLADVCRSHDALLVLDVAHSVLAQAPPADAVLVGTSSKALGSLGGFVAGPVPIVDLCRNVARSFIFTTASAPADAAAALAAIGVLRSPDGIRLTDRLRANVELISPGHVSPIVPIVIGEEAAAVAASLELLDAGLLVPAIRPPTVPPGSSRLRVALSAAHEAADVERLAAALDQIGHRPEVLGT
ncbi:MAG: 8-amino-7-oxononanoate synthase [Actinobacteria bacterium]|nr:8-amino-7-oxononanoate synthase [Actinomycetota bacterium]